MIVKIYVIFKSAEILTHIHAYYPIIHSLLIILIHHMHFRYIYVNPEYIQRYHRRHGHYDSFSSSGTGDRPHQHRHEVFEYDDI